MTAHQIKRFRKSLGMTQKQFAEYLGVRKNSVWRWENGYPIEAMTQRVLSLERKFKASEANG